MLRAVVLAAVCSLALAGSQLSAAVAPAARADVELLLAELERIHPNPYHDISRTELHAAAADLVARLPALDDDQLLVELMRLLARLGGREGHTGIAFFERTHQYPLYLYGFDDGFHVVAAVRGARPLVGARLVAIEGRAVEGLLPLLRAIMTHDNEMTYKTRYPSLLVSAEVLHGLGVTPTAERATFTFARANRAPFDVELTPTTFARYSRELQSAFPTYLYGLPARPKLTFLQRRGVDQRLTTLDRGRVAYLAYRSVQNDTYDYSERLRRLVQRPRIRRVVVDLRNNGGGNIATYTYLLQMLLSRAVRRRTLVVIIGRETFSAAVHFAVDVKRSTRAIFVGEPTGGSPNHYSDTDPVRLPVTGWTVGIPRIHYEKLPGQPGLALEPDLAVQLTARSYFGNRDPVLAAALRVRQVNRAQTFSTSRDTCGSSIEAAKLSTPEANTLAPASFS